MAKPLKLFSLLLIFLFSTMVAESKNDLDKYRLYVTNVDPEFHCFALSNQMTFCIAKNDWETGNLPEVGTEVSLVPRFTYPDMRYSVSEGDLSVLNFGSFHRGPMYQPKLTNIWMSPESKQYCFSFVSSESVCLQPAGWFSSAVNRDVIKLSDESQWIAEQEGRFGFKKGDRVIVTQINDSQWGIIDVDQNVTMESRHIKKMRIILPSLLSPIFPKKLADKNSLNNLKKEFNLYFQVAFQ